MNPIYRMWWRFLMDLRPLVRYLAERFPHLAAPAVRARTIAHFVVGNVLQVLASVCGLIVWALADGFRWGFAAWFSVALATEVIFQVTRSRGAHPALEWLVGWREAWRVRRRWPSDWATVAAKTAKVQAEVGTSREPIASARLRPIADHPKMSWWPQVTWPGVSWWVGPPPGRSFTAFDEVETQLAANISHCVDIVVDFDRTSDSYGRLVVTFTDPLQDTISPEPSDEVLEGRWPLPASDEPQVPALAVVPDEPDEWEAY